MVITVNYEKLLETLRSILYEAKKIGADNFSLATLKPYIKGGNELLDVAIRNIKVENEDYNIVKIYFKARNEYYYDIILRARNAKSDIFLGRYMKEYRKYRIDNGKEITDLGKVYFWYKNDKILIFTRDPVNNNIYRVLSLYNIIDDISYNVTEREALKIFDETLTSDYLKDNGNNSIFRIDDERILRLYRPPISNYCSSEIGEENNGVLPSDNSNVQNGKDNVVSIDKFRKRAIR